MLYYHASATADIAVLEPRVSNHGTPLVYVSQKREHILVYLSNAVEKFCRENGIAHSGPYYKWASYGFDKEGVLQIDEYWPDALRETYAGVSGYIYTVRHTDSLQPMKDIPHAFCSAKPLPTAGCEYVPNALEALLCAEREGLIRIRRYGDLGENTLRWLDSCIPREYENNGAHPDYRAFLKAKFPQFF